MNYQEITYWNLHSYGTAIRIKRGYLISLIVIACLLTPGTNWFIAFVNRLIKRDLVLRH